MKISAVSNNAFKSFNEQRERIEIKATNEANNKKNPEGANKKLVAAASLAGAVIPLAIYNYKKGNARGFVDAFKNGDIKGKTKALTNFLEVKDIKQIGISVAGSIAAGLGAGVALDKNPDNRKAKYKETLYEFMNCMIPMGIITAVEAGLKAKNIKPNLPGKAGMVAGGVLGGMFVSNKISNAANKHLFKESGDTFEKREMKPADCLVHMDDIIGVAVLTGVPFANQIGKVLPIIYSHVGYETGTKEAHEKPHHGHHACH